MFFSSSKGATEDGLFFCFFVYVVFQGNKSNMTYMVTLSSGILHPAAPSSTPRPLTSTHLMHNLYLMVSFTAARRLFPQTNSAKNLYCLPSKKKTNEKAATQNRWLSVSQGSETTLVGGFGEECCQYRLRAAQTIIWDWPRPSPPRSIFACLTLQRVFDVSRMLDGVDVEGFFFERRRETLKP